MKKKVIEIVLILLSIFRKLLIHCCRSPYQESHPLFPSFHHLFPHPRSFIASFVLHRGERRESHHTAIRSRIPPAPEAAGGGTEFYWRNYAAPSLLPRHHKSTSTRGGGKVGNGTRISIFPPSPFLDPTRGEIDACMDQCVDFIGMDRGRIIFFA